MYTKYILVLFSFFVLSSSAYAEHEGADKETIKALVEKVKKAVPSQRRLLMNELKIQLRTMHQETRTQVMLHLRRSFTGQQSTQIHKHPIDANMHNQNTMSMTESKHMQEQMIQASMDDKRGNGSAGTPPINRPAVGDKPIGNGPGNDGNPPQKPTGNQTPPNTPNNMGPSKPHTSKPRGR